MKPKIQHGLFVSLSWVYLLLPTIAVAAPEETRVSDSILGVQLGATLEAVNAQLGTVGTSVGRSTREGGRKEAWNLNDIDYASIALKTDSSGRVVWLTGFLRPGKEIPFSALGDLNLASGATDSQAIWNVSSPNGNYRLVAKGQNGKAQVIYFLSLLQ